MPLHSHRAPFPAGLALKLPPVLLLALCAVGVWLTPSWPPLATQIPEVWSQAAAAALVGTGLLISLAGVLAFRSAQTTVSPLSPAHTSQLVVRGIYRYSRNPMYVGFAGMLLGLVILRGQLSGLLWWAGMLWYLQRYQIQPEEQALHAKFGAVYAQYCQQVRRWL